MTKQVLLRKLEAIFDEWQQSRAWATLEIEFREGEPNMLRKHVNEKLGQPFSQGNTRDCQKTYR
jgi:hypothetical protein